MRGALVIAGALALGVAPAGRQVSRAEPPPNAYLSWTSSEAQQIGRNARAMGRVGGGQGLLHTERAYSYKLRATWLTPDVIRATARLAQLSDGLSVAQTEELVKEAEAAGDTVVLVEIDPNEGSGVIPTDWAAFLGPKEARIGDPEMVKGTSVSKLRDQRALSGVFRRDYAYEVFWIVFPLTSESGAPVFPERVAEAELVVRIYNKEGRVKWPVPDSIRARSRSRPR